MRFEITDIEFDFSDSFEVENTDQDLIDEVLATIWENLMRMISSKRSHLASGWCIKSIDYRHVLK